MLTFTEKATEASLILNTQPKKTGKMMNIRSWTLHWQWTCAGDSGLSKSRMIYYFESAAVAVDSSHVTASSSSLWIRFSSPSSFVNGHLSTMWFMVCHWPQSQEGDLCQLARHGPWPVQKWFIRDHVWRGRSKPGCQIVGLVTIVWLTTEADVQSCLHCVKIVSTDIMSDHIGRRDTSCRGGCWKTPAHTG